MGTTLMGKIFKLSTYTSLRVEKLFIVQKALPISKLIQSQIPNLNLRCSIFLAKF